MQRPAARDTDRRRYRNIEAKYGEDPARFLAEGLDLDPRPRIRGIESLELLQKWQEVELEVGPRKAVIAAINARKDELEANSVDAEVTPAEVSV